MSTAGSTGRALLFMRSDPSSRSGARTSEGGGQVRLAIARTLDAGRSVDQAATNHGSHLEQPGSEL